MSTINLINPQRYDFTVNKLREFFRSKGFLEVPVQHRLSILAACEDPQTIATFNYAGSVWPLPQTGQMWLEYELLNNPEAAGYYCISTSYRNEAEPIAGRHDFVFPMFEFETHGDVSDLEKLEVELLEFLGFGLSDKYCFHDYDAVARRYRVKELEAEHENQMWQDFGSIFFLKRFPQSTSPFWNMKKVGEYANKIDVILYGMETIGSAERSTDPNEMRHLFHTISDGMYAEMLYAQFGKDRVKEELEKFLAFKFFPRCGGGMGLTRMIRALKLAKVLK